MCGIELAADPLRDESYDPALRIGHEVTLAARGRGAIVRPLGDVVILMPPLSIEESELEQLVDITGDGDRGGVRVGSPAAECGRAGASRLKESTLQTSRCDGTQARS